MFTIRVCAMDQLHFLIRSAPEPVQDAVWPLSTYLAGLEKVAMAARSLSMEAGRKGSDSGTVGEALNRLDDSLRVISMLPQEEERCHE